MKDVKIFGEALRELIRMHGMHEERTFAAVFMKRARLYFSPERQRLEEFIGPADFKSLSEGRVPKSYKHGAWLDDPSETISVYALNKAELRELRVKVPAYRLQGKVATCTLYPRSVIVDNVTVPFFGCLYSWHSGRRSIQSVTEVEPGSSSYVSLGSQLERDPAEARHYSLREDALDIVPDVDRPRRGSVDERVTTKPLDEIIRR